MPSTTASLELEVKSDSVGKARNALGQFEKSADKAETATRKFSKAAKIGITVGLGLATVAIVKTTKAWLKYDKAMKEVQSISGQTAEEFKSVRKEMLGISASLGIASEDIAAATYQAVSAGIAAKDAGTFMREAGKLALAGVASTESAVDLLTTAVNAYGLEVEQTSELSDKFFTAVKLGKTTITELASSFAKAAPLAATMGISIDEVLASLVTMTKQGISTAESFTKINAIMVALVKPSKEMATALNDIGQASGKSAIENLGLQGTIEALIGSVDGNFTAVGALFPQVES